METVLVLGGTGCLGSCILEVLMTGPYRVRATARTSLKAEQLKPSVHEVVICDPTHPATLTPDLVQGVTYIISALGKSLNLTDRSKTCFKEVDFQGNLNILQLALEHGSVKKYVYVGAYSSEKHPKIAYFKAHEDFAQSLLKCGIPATIVKPPALFSAFLDVMPMARKGRLASVGPGNCLTNPIHELEVAEACVEALTQPEKVVELGGPISYSRMDLLQLINEKAGQADKDITKVPYWLVISVLPVLRVMNRSLYEKAAFFAEVTQTDCVAPAKGKLRLEDYLAEHI